MKRVKDRALATATVGFYSGVLSMLIGASWTMGLLISAVVFLVLMTVYIAFEWKDPDGRIL